MDVKQRDYQSTGIRNHLTEDWANRNVSGNPYHLHHWETCFCDLGKIGRAKKEAANKKRSNFYKTKRGLKIKQKYKDRVNYKKELISQRTNADCPSYLGAMEKELILKLIRKIN